MGMESVATRLARGVLAIGRGAWTTIKVAFIVIVSLTIILAVMAGIALMRGDTAPVTGR